jgi:hypothetical protein
MRIVYRISEEDYVGARDLFAANEKPWYRRVSRRLLPWLGGLGIVLLLLRYVVVFPDRNPVVTAAGLMIGAYFLYCGFALRRYFRRSYQKDRRFQHDFTADVSEEGVHFVTPNSDSRVKWGGFVRFLESDEIFMLFHAEWVFSIIPKRAFAPGETDHFRDPLRRHIAAVR